MASMSQSGSAHRATSETGFDGLLLFAAAILLFAGILTQFSINVDSDLGEFRKHLLFTLIGLVPFALFFWVNPLFWKRIAPWLYFLSLVLLVLVLVRGELIMGARRWILVGPMQFQPSEPAKLLMILSLGALFANRQDRIRDFSTFALSLLFVVPPLFLVFRQPHLGGALVITAIWLAMSMAAGVRLRFIVGSIVAIPLLIGSAYVTPRVLTLEQKERIHSMFFSDPDGANYQVERASMAFAAGGVTGTGFLRGEQKKAGFIPQQHNDFIFTVVGEEGGLIGCALVIAAFGFFFYRVWLVMVQSDELYFRAIAGGVLGLLAFHTVVNIGMVVQLLPVVGLWLPFMSAGGTALWLCMACVGLLLGIRRRERPLLF
jgi:rod shape determining protein RodA